MRIRIANSTSIMGHNVRHTLGTNRLLDDLAQLELTFLLGNAMSCKATLDVVEKAERLVSFVNANHI